MKLDEILDHLNYFTLSMPVDVEGLARALALKVERQNLPDEVCGMIKKTEKGYVIVVNQNDIITKQRFTISRELGHYLYHRDKIEDYINTTINEKDEQQANNFAANLLMPSSLIKKIIKNKLSNEVNPAQLAKELNVSIPAINIRLNNLGLL